MVKNGMIVFGVFGVMIIVGYTAIFGFDVHSFTLLIIGGILLSPIGVIIAIGAIVSHNIEHQRLEREQQRLEREQQIIEREQQIIEQEQQIIEHERQITNYRKEQHHKIDVLIDTHIKTLSRKKKKCVVYDDYGYSELNFVKWDKDVNTFTESVVIRELVNHTEDIYIIVRTTIEEKLGIHDLNNVDVGSSQIFDENMDGIEYEHYCSDIFKKHGWDARVTTASNDQGADIIVKRNNIDCVVQCKRYSTPVGNKAVQEAHSAKSYYDTVMAIVVTNNTYTPSAKTLANKLGIQLLHHEDIATISV